MGLGPQGPVFPALGGLRGLVFSGLRVRFQGAVSYPPHFPPPPFSGCCCRAVGVVCVIDLYWARGAPLHGRHYVSTSRRRRVVDMYCLLGGTVPGTGGSSLSLGPPRGAQVEYL